MGQEERPTGGSERVAHKRTALTRTVIIYRLVVALLGWSAILILWIRAIVQRPASSSALAAFAGSLRYFSIQTNLMVLIWLVVALIYWRSTAEPMLLRPLFKGAFTVYISVTFIVFLTVLAPLVNPQGVDRFVNGVIHYITPIAFIADFLLFDRGRAYQWRYGFVWLVYPTAYLIFALIHGSMTGSYIYPFLDLVQLGVGGLATWVAILLLLFVLLGALFVGVSKLPWRSARSSPVGE